MPSQTQQRFDFRGGTSRLRRQNQNQVFYCQNARFMADGSIEVKQGQTLQVNIAATGGIEALLVAYSASTLLRFYSVRRTGEPDDTLHAGISKITGTLFGKGPYTSIVAYKGVIFFSNGIGAINYHQPGVVPSEPWGASKWGATVWGNPNRGAEVSGSPTPPVGAHLLIYKDRMYVGKSNGEIAYSNVGLFETLPTVDFPTLNAFTIGGTNDPIKGMTKGEDFLLALTSSTYNIMTGEPGDDNDLGDATWQTYPAVGTKSSRSVVSQGRKSAFFGSNRNIYILNGTVLTNIDPLDLMKEYRDAPSDNVLYAVAFAFVGDELWMYFPVGGNAKSGRTLVYSEDKKNWTVFTDVDGYALFYSPDRGRLFVGKHSESKIYDPDLGLKEPDGTLPEFIFKSRQEVLGSLRKTKTYKLLNVQADVNKDESMTVAYAINNTTQYTTFGVGSLAGDTGKIWGTAVWGAQKWGGITPQNKFFRPTSGGNGVRGKEIRIKLSGNVSPGTRLLGYEIEGDIEPRDDEGIA